MWMKSQVANENSLPTVWTGSWSDSMGLVQPYGLGVPSTATPTQVKTCFSLTAPALTQIG